MKERLFAHPENPAAYAAGGAAQVQSAAFAISSFKNYFSDALHLAKNQYTLAPLVKGSIVVAGTIIGRIAANSATQASHLYFQIRPAGRNAPLIDPKPLLDGWKLMQATALYRAKGIDPFFGQGAKNASVGEVLLMSKDQLQQRILHDTHVYARRLHGASGRGRQPDRRVLAVLEFLCASGLNPAASSPDCLGQSAGPNQASATAGGSSIDILKINGIPVLGHQGDGSISDIAIRRLLTLQSSMAPVTDHQPDELQGRADDAGAAGPQQPDPDRLHAAVRSEREARPADLEHPQAEAVDQPDQPDRADPRAGDPHQP